MGVFVLAGAFFLIVGLPTLTGDAEDPLWQMPGASGHFLVAPEDLRQPLGEFRWSTAPVDLGGRP